MSTSSVLPLHPSVSTSTTTPISPLLHQPILLTQSKQPNTSKPTISSLPNPILTLRARLCHLCKSGRPDLARCLFDTISRPAPTILWNTLLIGFVCNSMPDDALRLYADMNSISPAVESDHYSYSSALKACADTRQLKLGKSVHCRILRRSLKPKNRVLNNSLLNMYTSCFEDSWTDGVERMFWRMPKRNVVSWNTMIDWYVKIARPLESLRHFKLMMEAGIEPTTVSFVNVFPAVASIGNEKIADFLLGLLCKFGSEKVNDLFVVSSSILMYSELGDIQFARQIFDCAIEKNIEVWNTMIGGYVQNDLPEEALQLFVEIITSDAVPVDTVTFVAALMAVSQSQVIRVGQQIHAHIIKKKRRKKQQKHDTSLELPVILMNALMVMYSRCDSVADAFKVFQQMQERDVVSWNTMISSLVQNGLNFEGLLLVYQMLKEGYVIDSITIVALLSAASNTRDIRIGKETHAYLIRQGIECAGMNSYLIDMYSNSGSIETARRLFDVDDQSCEKDQVTWNAMIAGYTHSSLIEQAVSVFKQMVEEDQRPNSVTLSSILPVCSTIGGIRLGKQIHAFAFRHSLNRNVFVETALIDMYSKCGAITYAEDVFRGVLDRNSVTYTTMISGFGQHGLGERALSLFSSMIETGMRPDAITFVAILSACSYSGLVDDGLEVFESMESKFGITPMTEHYGCVVDMLGRNGRVEEAYNYVINLGETGEVVGIWGSLLAACKMHGKFELGKVVAERLFEIDKEDTQPGYHVLLSNAYAAERKWESVDGIRREMRDKGLSKQPGSSWIEVGDLTHRFVSRDQTHPQNEQIHDILVDLAAEMKLSGYKTEFIVEEM